MYAHMCDAGSSKRKHLSTKNTSQAHIPTHKQCKTATHLELCILQQPSDASHGLAKAQQCALAGSSSSIHGLLARLGHCCIKGSHLGAQLALQLLPHLRHVWQQLSHAVNGRLQQQQQQQEDILHYVSVT